MPVTGVSGGVAVLGGLRVPWPNPGAQVESVNMQLEWRSTAAHRDRELTGAISRVADGCSSWGRATNPGHRTAFPCRNLTVRKAGSARPRGFRRRPARAANGSTTRTRTRKETAGKRKPAGVPRVTAPLPRSTAETRMPFRERVETSVYRAPPGCDCRSGSTGPSGRTRGQRAARRDLGGSRLGRRGQVHLRGFRLHDARINVKLTLK